MTSLSALAFGNGNGRPAKNSREISNPCVVEVSALERSPVAEDPLTKIAVEFIVKIVLVCDRENAELPVPQVVRVDDTVPCRWRVEDAESPKRGVRLCSLPAADVEQMLANLRVAVSVELVCDRRITLKLFQHHRDLGCGGRVKPPQASQIRSSAVMDVDVHYIGIDIDR